MIGNDLWIATDHQARLWIAGDYEKQPAGQQQQQGRTAGSSWVQSGTSMVGQYSFHCALTDKNNPF